MSTLLQRRSALFWAGLVLVLLTLPAGYFLVLGRAPAPAPAPTPQVAQPAELRIAAIDGTVEVRRRDGQWVPARVGERVTPSENVRTGPGSTARLSGGSTFEVRVEPSTEIGVAELSASISRLMLQSGMAIAEVKGQARHLFEVKAVGSDAVARTRRGTFAITNNGNGTVAVGTRAGEVELIGKEQVVIVRAGEQSIVRPGQPPSPPAPMPASLLLKVSLPPTSVLTRRKVIVAGEVEPGAVVEVGGRPASVDERGKFSFPLELPEGHTGLEVRARSVGGREQISSHSLEVDSRVTKMTIEAPDWKAPGP